MAYRIMSDPSKTASKATQRLVMAALYLLFGVIYLVASSKSDHLVIGGVFVMIALIYAGLAKRAAQRGTAHFVTKD